VSSGKVPSTRLERDPKFHLEIIIDDEMRADRYDAEIKQQCQW